MDVFTVGSIAIPTAVFTAGVAWGAVRQSLNGTRAAVKETRDLLQDHVKSDDAVQRELLQRSAALEAKAEIIIQKLDRR